MSGGTRMGELEMREKLRGGGQRSCKQRTREEKRIEYLSRIENEMISFYIKRKIAL